MKSLFKNFDEVFALVQELETPPTLGVVAPYDEQTIDAALAGREKGLAEPLFIGHETRIQKVIAKMGLTQDLQIFHVDGDEASAARATMHLVNDGKVQSLMKGKIETSTLLKAVVNKENGIGTGRLMSHIAFNYLPSYHKLLITTDGGMVMFPTLEQKKKILQNAVEVMHQVGYEKPKIGCLALVEKVNPDLQETVDADALKTMYLNGEITGCIVEGPISLDLAIHKESAEIKGYESEVAGDVDVLVSPYITVSNVLGKSIVYAGNGSMAGIVYGAKVPILLTSRGSSAEEKLQSIALASLIKMEN